MEFEKLGRSYQKVSIRKEFEFHAAHHLPNHEGKCANLHGHTYKLFVTLKDGVIVTPGYPAEGMVIDFGDLKKIVNALIIDLVDHQNLDEVLSFRTTAENMAGWMLAALLAAELPVTKIELYETPSACAIVEVE